MLSDTQTHIQTIKIKKNNWPVQSSMRTCIKQQKRKAYTVNKAEMTDYFAQLHYIMLLQFVYAVRSSHWSLQTSEL